LSAEYCSRLKLKTATKKQKVDCWSRLLMDYIEQVLEKLKEWAQKLIEILLGPEPEPEADLIPVPVDEPRRRHR
jgi:hypothetical protein